MTVTTWLEPAATSKDAGVTAYSALVPVARATVPVSGAVPEFEIVKVLVEVEPLRVDAGCGQPRHQGLQLGPHEEGLAQLFARDRPDPYAPVRHEGDQPGRGQAAKGFADGRSADPEPLGELLLSQNGARCELAGEDGVLERHGDLVRLGAAAALARVRRQVRNCAASVDPSRASVELVPPVTACATASK